jgi:dTDP-4-amino-4,6-dideoxygalactose transaminase
MPRVPFNRPSAEPEAIRLVEEALAGTEWGGNGPFARRCEDVLGELIDSARVFLTPSGTHALELAALLLNLGKGDEVIVPSFTFPSTAGAFALRGARLVFADIRPDTLNIDESTLEPLISGRTRAIVPVHYAGIGCEMESILSLAEKYGIEVVEDNAHGLFGSYRGRQLGTFGRFAALSFHETKNFPIGEGGALVMRDAIDVERTEILREHGTDRSKFFRGETDRYTWVEVGSSYMMSELQAAVLHAQLGAREKIQNRRKRIWDRYAKELRGWAEDGSVRLPSVPQVCAPAYHLFYLILPDRQKRDSLIEHLRTEGISAHFHYQPLHLSQAGAKIDHGTSRCPVSELVSGRLVRLPFYNGLGDSDQAAVINAVQTFSSV